MIVEKSRKIAPFLLMFVAVVIGALIYSRLNSAIVTTPIATSPVNTLLSPTPNPFSIIEYKNIEKALNKLPGVSADKSAVIDDGEEREVVTLPDLVICGVMSRSYLHSACQQYKTGRALIPSHRIANGQVGRQLSGNQPVHYSPR